MNTHSFSIRHKNGWGTGLGPRPTHCHTCKCELPLPLGTGATGYGCSDEETISPDQMRHYVEVQAMKIGECVTRSQAHCYQCCADSERARMIETGRATLYLSFTWGTRTVEGKHGERRHAFGRYTACTVSDWAGKLSFIGRMHIGHHNMARVRYDVTFTGPDGKAWRGTTYGDNTQICHCRRLKGRA